MDKDLKSSPWGVSEGHSTNLLGTFSGKERNAWKIPPGIGSYHVSSDVRLFSSSLPVLPHDKLNFGDSEQCFLFSDDGFPSLSKLQLEDEHKDALEVTEPSPFGSLLPGDEEELLAGIMDDFDLSELPTQLEDLDDDFFGSGGGLEMESETQESLLNRLTKLSMPDGIPGNNTLHYAFPNGVSTVAGEHPYGEHPSRTLFVRNINSNVEDSELRSLFEEKNSLAFVKDTLTLHGNYVYLTFAICRVPTGITVNWLKKQYGDIRTLYTACKHRGFVMISYYDIRAARTAMRALQNKPLRRRRLDIHFSIPKDNPSEKDINQGTLVVFNLDASVSNDDLRQIFGAYGEIKEIRETPHKRHHKFIEFYDVRAAEAALKALNRSDIAGKRIKLEPSRPGGARRNLMQQLTQELEHDEGRNFRHQVGSPLASSPPGWPNFGSPVEHNSMHGYGLSPGMGSISPISSNPLPGLASILPNHVSSPGKMAPIGKDTGRNLSSSPGPVSPFLDLKSKSSGIRTLSGPQFLWGSPSHQAERTSPAWSTSPIGHPLTSSRHGQAHPYSSRQSSFLGSQFHVGSAPSGIPLDRQFGFFPESPETSYMNQVAFGSTGSSNRNHLMNSGSLNIGVAIAGNLSESSSPSSRIMMPLSRNGPAFYGNGSCGGIGASNLEVLNDRSRNRRVDSGNQIDNKKQYQLDLEKIMNGEDTRTTLMIKNIPNKYTSKMLLAAIDESHNGAYDFLYLPIDFKNKCNVGYAFINMVSPSHIISFYEVFNGKKWEKFNSEKVASLAYARIQGKAALVAHFQNSSLMNEDKRCRPILIQSEGEGEGNQELFPSSNLNICIRQPDGSYTGDSLDSPKGNLDENLEKSSLWMES